MEHRHRAMKRRDFITLLGGFAVSSPLAAHAQRPKTLPKVGVLWHAGSAEEEAIYIRALNQGLSVLRAWLSRLPPFQSTCWLRSPKRQPKQPPERQRKSRLYLPSYPIPLDRN